MAWCLREASARTLPWSAKACQGLAEVGYEIDLARNNEAVGKASEISTDSSRIRIMVIPTNEELLIARDTFRVVRDLPIPS